MFPCLADASLEFRVCAPRLTLIVFDATARGQFRSRVNRANNRKLVSGCAAFERPSSGRTINAGINTSGCIRCELKSGG